MKFSESQTSMCNVVLGRLIPETFFVSEMFYFRKLIPNTKIHVCNLFWLGCSALHSWEPQTFVTLAMGSLPTQAPLPAIVALPTLGLGCRCNAER